MLQIGKKPNKAIRCDRCNEFFKSNNIVVFDSKTEWGRGWNLKKLERAEIITDLKHHEVFELLPKLHVAPNYAQGNEIVFTNDYTKLSITSMNNKKYPALFEITHRYLKYESDFTYKKDGELVVEEVKGLTKKKVTKSIYTCPECGTIVRDKHTRQCCDCLAILKKRNKYETIIKMIGKITLNVNLSPRNLYSSIQQP